MRRTAIFSRSRSSRSSERICAWIVTSSAVVGSSAMRSAGSRASAIAIIARCRMPPLNWWGYSRARRSGSGMPTFRSHSTARSAASRPPHTLCAVNTSAT